MKVKFEILNKGKDSLGMQTESFLFDSGSEGGVMLSNSYIQDFKLSYEDLGSINILSPGNSGRIEKACLIIIHEINLGKQNILEKPLKNIHLIFSSNKHQTPVIGQNCFSNFECIINYKNKKFSINKI